MHIFLEASLARASMLAEALIQANREEEKKTFSLEPLSLSSLCSSKKPVFDSRMMIDLQTSIIVQTQTRKSYMP